MKPSHPTGGRTSLILALSLVMAATLPAYASLPQPEAGQSAAVRPQAIDGLNIEQRLGKKIPGDILLTDDHGDQVRFGELTADRPAVLAMVYYECPMLCTLVLNGALKAMRALSLETGVDYDLIAVSFDPEETSDLAAAKKQAYLDMYKRDPEGRGWRFLTGSEQEVARLAEAVGFDYRYQPETDEYAHGAALMVLTPDGTLARYFYGIEYSARDLQLALVEAAAGKIGSVVDQLLLFCYRYDPSTGRYSAATMTLVRVGGVATVLAFLGFFVVTRRKELRTATAKAASQDGTNRSEER